jgi:diacylglycerol kinase family enzyme
MAVQSVIVSESETHFEQVVRNFFKSDTMFLLIYGGDGTINRALNCGAHVWKQFTSSIPPGHFHSDTTSRDSNRGGGPSVKSIGFLRGGSGNGYHDSYEVPRMLKRQLRSSMDSMYQNRSCDVDVMKINDGSKVYYGQLFGLGFDARVLKRRNAKKVTGDAKIVKPGLLNYILSTLSTLANLEIPAKRTGKRYILELSEGLEIGDSSKGEKKRPFRYLKFETDAPLIEICKRSYYGNRFRICPGALSDSGLLDVKVFDFEKKPPVLINLLPLWRGWHGWINRKARSDGGARIAHYRARQISISSAESLEYHVDGELVTPPEGEPRPGKVHFTVLPKAFLFLVSEKYLRKAGRKKTSNS